MDAPLPTAPTGAETLVLAATLNGLPTNQLLTIVRSPDGDLLARADELRDLHFDPSYLRSSSGLVDLAALPGLSSSYDEGAQAVTLTAPAMLLEPYEIRLDSGENNVDLDAVRPTPGALLNYELFAQAGHGRTALSGNTEFIGMTGVGIVSTSATFDTWRAAGVNSIVRLDTSWRRIDPRQIRSITLGDFVSNAVSWSSSVRLAGLQIASAFEQRSDIVTTALPEFSGSAQVPTTLDLYIDQQRVFSGEVPAGPFDIRSLPFVSGGDVRLVTTDASGRQVEIRKSYYYLPSQLRKGLLEYSIDIGAPRLDYATKSFRYDDTFFGSASARYGLSSMTTIEGHAEASVDGLINLGGGAIQSLGGFGAITASVAASDYGGRQGIKVSAQVEGRFFRGVRFFFGTERASEGYFDLARVSAVRAMRRGDVDQSAIASFVLGTAQARAIDRAGLSFMPGWGSLSVNLTYNGVKSPNLDQKIAGLSLSRQFGEAVSLNASGYADLEDHRSYGLFASLNVRIGTRVIATAGVQRDGSDTAYTFNAQSNAGERQGDIGWGVTDSEAPAGNSDDQRSAYVSYRASQALVRAEVDQSGPQWRGTLDIEGSVVAAGGGVFLANRIDNSFIVVRNAGPGTGIIQGGVPMGRANGDGRFLLADIQPYYSQHVYLDPTTTADGWEPHATELVAVAGYREGAVVDFGAVRAHSAIITVIGADGKVLPAGSLAVLDGGESMPIGYDGQVYLRGLKANNRFTVDLGPAGVCAGSFDYDAKTAAQPMIGPVTCR